MRNIMLSLAAASLAIPAAFTIPTDKAEAKSHRHRHYEHREWRGRDGRTYCRKSDGTVGLLIGGAAGALAGRAIDTRGERTTGPVLGAAPRALIGTEVASTTRCRPPSTRETKAVRHRPGPFRATRHKAGRG